MFCGQTDTGHKDDIYLYRSSSPRLLAFSLGDKYGTHYEYCVNELTPSLSIQRGGGRRRGTHERANMSPVSGVFWTFTKYLMTKGKSISFKTLNISISVVLILFFIRILLH